MSRPRLKISSSVIERLNRIKEPSIGQLFGTLFDNTLLVVGFNISSQKKNVEEEGTEDLEWQNVSEYDILPNLAAEVDLCGVFMVFDANQEIDKDLWVQDISDIDITDNPVLLKVNIEKRETDANFYIHTKLEKAEFEIVSENDVLKWFLNIRLTARITLSCDFQFDSVQESISGLRKKLVSGAAAFHILNTNIYLLNDDADISGISGNLGINELFPESGDTSDLSVKIKKKNGFSMIEPIFVEMYMKGTNSETSQVAPVIKYVKKDFKNAKINLSIDTLAMVKKETKVNQLYGILVESVCRSLKLNEWCLMSQLEQSKNEVSLPRTYHFLPPGFGHFVSIAYPFKWDENDLKSIRETFHTSLGLPMDRPFFRKANAVSFNQEAKNETILINPHEGLNPSGVKDGEVSLVQGLYAYHHYMQDRFDDKGWGCAYRSLQTICSWFRLQGYTQRPVPSHKEIQQCLVDIGDKPASFVGSRQWIGSTEVSFCLDSLLGVSSRIVSVRSGDELSTKGGELSHHFRTQGTPVMIGGGVLAHTIIGVDFNRKTGSLKFLILDPHYTEGEDLKVIQSKGWCAWKTVEFWKKDAFYNMCLPLRPKSC